MGTRRLLGQQPISCGLPLPYPFQHLLVSVWVQGSLSVFRYNQYFNLWASPVAQWLRIRLPMQGTRVRALVREDPTCSRATKPMHHNYWACALEPTSHNYWAHVPQLLKPACLEPVLRNKRNHHNEKSTHHNEEQPPLAATRESLRAAAKTQHGQK